MKRARTQAANARSKPAPSPFQAFPGNKPRYSVAETAALLGISRALTWARIRSGELASVRDGARVFVTDLEVARYARVSHGAEE